MQKQLYLQLITLANFAECYIVPSKFSPALGREFKNALRRPGGEAVSSCIMVGNFRSRIEKSVMETGVRQEWKRCKV